MMILNMFARWGLKMKLHVIIGVLSVFLHYHVAKAEEIKEARDVAMTIKKYPDKAKFDSFVDKNLKPVLPVLEKKLAGEKDESKAAKMVDSLSKLGDAAGVKVETVADRSFKINGLVTIRSILQNWSGRDIVFDVVGKSVRIDKDDIYKVRSSNQPLAKQAYLLWAMVEDNLNQQGIVFPK